MPSLQKIVIQDFRNIAFQELSFSPNINCISGLNGAGKTNLLNAIYYLSMTKSAFPAPDRCNIRYGQSAFAIGGSYQIGAGMRARFSLRVSAEGEKKMLRDDKAYPRMSAHIGTLPVVMISPGDSSLVSDSGEDRRRFLNAVLSQMDSSYLQAIQHYNRLLMQRNHLLKETSVPNWELISILDGQMSVHADTIRSGRQAFVEALNPIVSQYYQLISAGREAVSVRYVSELQKMSLEELFLQRRERDTLLHYTSAGIQRDELIFEMEGNPIRRCGSQGQQKSFLVALKFAQYELMKKGYGFAPMLLMDDVFDKLDMSRIANLIEMVAGSNFGQIFITDANKVRLSAIVDAITDDRAYFECADGTFSRLDV